MKLKCLDILAFLIPHVIAGGVYLILFLVVPVLLVGILVFLLLIGGILAGEPGGALFLPMTFLLGILYALCVAGLGVLLLIATSGVQLVRRRVRVPAWIPAALTLPFAFGAAVLTEYPASFLGVTVSAGFLTYWLAFSGSDFTMKWIGRRWRNWRKARESTRESPVSSAVAPAEAGA